MPVRVRPDISLDLSSFSDRLPLCCLPNPGTSCSGVECRESEPISKMRAYFSSKGGSMSSDPGTISAALVVFYSELLLLRLEMMMTDASTDDNNNNNNKKKLLPRLRTVICLGQFHPCTLWPDPSLPVSVTKPCLLFTILPLVVIQITRFAAKRTERESEKKTSIVCCVVELLPWKTQADWSNESTTRNERFTFGGCWNTRPSGNSDPEFDKCVCGGRHRLDEADAFGEEDLLLCIASHDKKNVFALQVQ